MRRVVLAALGLTLAASAFVAPGAGADVDPVKGTINRNPTVTNTPIASSGPITNIEIGDELSCQVAYQWLFTWGSQNQIYPPWLAPGDCGTFLAVRDTLYAPHFFSHGGTATGGLGPYTGFTKISQTKQTGSGTLADPYIVTTVVDAGSTGLRITQIDTYVVGRRDYRTDIVVTNNATFTQSAVLSRGMDCYLKGSDSGKGILLPNVPAQTTGVGCVASNTSARSQRLIPLTAGNSYMQGHYSAVWNAIGAKAALPNTCQCATITDNGIAVAWNISLPPNGSVIRTVLHSFTDFSFPIDVELPVDHAVRCEVDPGAIPTDDPRPTVNCDLDPATPTGIETGRCAATATGSARGGAAGAATCAVPGAGAGCYVTARPPGGDGKQAAPCEVWVESDARDATRRVSRR